MPPDRSEPEQDLLRARRRGLAYQGPRPRAARRETERRTRKPDVEGVRRIEEYMELRKPFSPMELLLADGEVAAGLAQVGVPTKEVPFRAVLALVDGRKCASECVKEGKVSALRLPDGNIQMRITETAGGWRPV